MTNEKAATDHGQPPLALDTATLSHRTDTGGRRRAAAKLLMPPLEPCGCIRDPDHDRHRCRDDITLAQADAVIATANYLESIGCTPVFEPHTLRAAWRLCPEHRVRLERLARRSAA
ncbi:hypothetical protein MPUL_41150 [Mycolicibacterium pulveris]|uniref:Uncharacterized protein n=1 Tax=Mycolicibacterium pulveris TaxID=36813 RepID=A0A7I7UNM9_MYCPV|nr:hypothetical protein MPUL_41150 [Mycolicibacterium pulveris]